MRLKRSPFTYIKYYIFTVLIIKKTTKIGKTLANTIIIKL